MNNKSHTARALPAHVISARYINLDPLLVTFVTSLMGLFNFFKNLFARRVKVDEIASEDIIIVYVLSTCSETVFIRQLQCDWAHGSGKKFCESLGPTDNDNYLTWIVH